MTRLSLYQGDRTLNLDFAPPTTSGETDALVKKAKTQLQGFIGTEATSTHLADFEKNLRAWLASGSASGLVSLERAIEGSVPKARTPVALRFHAAHEIEMRGREISAPKLGYSDTVADTGTKIGEWDLFALTADQVNDSGTKGCIEVVFAKHNVTDAKELDRRATVMKLLDSALATHGGGKLSVAVDAFNVALADAAKADPGLTKYRLDNVPANVNVQVKGPTFYSTQTNVEVDLKKLGDPNDATVPALFTGPHHADDKAMFQEARRQATALVNDVFRDTAHSLHGGRYKKDSIKLDKMKGAFTLLLYSTAKVKQQDSKGAWPVLPKVGAGDIIRQTFNTRDKLTLFAHTSDSGKYDALESKMMAAIAEVKSKREFGRTIGTVENMNLGGKKVSEADFMKDELRDLLIPGKLPDRWGTETQCYGKVDWDNEDYSGTVTGKPIPTTYNSVKRNLTSKRPKVVLEVRRMDNPINALVESQTRSDTPDFGGSDAYKNLVAAASPWTKVRPRKQATV